MTTLSQTKEKVVEYLSEAGQSKALGISMMLNVSIRNTLMMQALRDLESEGRIKKDGLNRYTSIRKPSAATVAQSAETKKKATAAIKPQTRKPSVRKPMKPAEKPVAKTKPKKEVPVNSVASKTAKPEVEKLPETTARSLEYVIAKMENRLKAGPIADYENKVTVLTRLASVSEPEVYDILMEIAEDLREVDLRALRHA